MKRTSLNSVFMVASIAIFSSCGSDRAQPLETASSTMALELHTFTQSFLEVDELAGGPGDANLFLENPIYKMPVPDPGNPPPDEAWGDWNDLDPATHRLQDLNNDKAVDESSFPRSNECVAGSKVLSKMDLTYVGVANNQEYAYFAVQRSNNNGDAGYYWLMTKEEPTLVLGAGPCKPGERQLVFNIRQGDVLLSGHFQPSATPLLEVYTADHDALGITAVQAINFTSGLWIKNTTAIEAVAVNTSPTQPGIWGNAGVDKQAITGAGEVEEWIFAESAIKTSLFTNGSICDATFFGTVITRSSGSGGTTPDLKDLAGPRKFSFGSITGEATLTPSCEESFDYAATLKGLDGTEVQNPGCSWTFKDSGGQVVAQPTDCSGTLSLPPGTYTGSVTLSDPFTSCSTVVPDKQIQIYPKLKATANLGRTCLSKFTYSGSASDGSGPYSYAWTFSGGGSVNPASSGQSSGEVLVGQGNVDYFGELTVTDSRGCKIKVNPDAVKPLDPLTVVLSMNAYADVCSSNKDEVTFVATAAGGNGSYVYTWSSIGAPACVPDITGKSCLVNPPDNDFCADVAVSVLVNDTSGICGAIAPPAQGVYAKVTTVNAGVQALP